MSSEFERIARLRAIYGEAHEGVELGIGDDAAILAPGIVLSVDAAVEGVHFRREWVGRGASWEDVGRRAAIAALSDLAAMGATPRAMLQALTLPADTAEEVVDAIARGTADVASAHGAPVIGGNLARARDLTITTTVVGTNAGASLRRDGAQVGDALYVTGVLGAAALGLAALEAGLADDADAQPFVRRFLSPTPRIAEGRAALGIAHACVDVSDGLAQDALHLCVASGVGAELELALLPLAPGHGALARRLGRDEVQVVLSGGEDFELVLAAPEGAVLEGARRIGRVVEGRGVVVRAADGSGVAIEGGGFDHFRAPAR